MQMAADDIIRKAMTMARIIYPGESIPEDKADQVFDSLNGLIESLSLETLTIRAKVQEYFTLTPGTTEYTYGDGGDFDSDYPLFIEDSAFIRRGGKDYPVSYVTPEEYRVKVTNKSISGVPFLWTYEADHPLIKIYIFPSPSSADTIHFRTENEFTAFTDRTTEVEFAPGYGMMLISQLAVDICPDFGKKVSNGLALKADGYLARVKHSNNRKKRISMSTNQLAGVTNRRRGFNIIEGPVR